MKKVWNSEMRATNPQRFVVADCTASDGYLKLPGGEVVLSGKTVAYVLKERAVPDAAATARAKLEQAIADNLIPQYTIGLSDIGGGRRWCVWIPGETSLTRCIGSGGTPAEALAQAAAHVETLRQPVLPDVDGMTLARVVDELVARGIDIRHTLRDARAQTGAQ